MSVDASSLSESLAGVVREAGEQILAIVRRGFDVEAKGDKSPVTEADRAAEAVILKALSGLAPDIPVVAEEEAAAGRIPALSSRFFLVDPLDGTKEFIRGGNDYTVNIGLIDQGVPVMGLVYAPATDTLYVGATGSGAWRERDGVREGISVRPLGDKVTAVASKSHFSPPTARYLEAVGASDYVSIGSSLKFCLVAEGSADIYPRLGPTCEWDTAAGHAVLLAAGGRVDGPDGRPLPYGKANTFLNPVFVATAGWEAPKLAPFAEPTEPTGV